MKPEDHHVGNVRERLAGLKVDPWKAYWTARQRITAAHRRRFQL